MTLETIGNFISAAIFGGVLYWVFYEVIKLKHRLQNFIDNIANFIMETRQFKKEFDAHKSGLATDLTNWVTKQNDHHRQLKKIEQLISLWKPKQ